MQPTPQILYEQWIQVAGPAVQRMMQQLKEMHTEMEAMLSIIQGSCSHPEVWQGIVRCPFTTAGDQLFFKCAFCGAHLTDPKYAARVRKAKGEEVLRDAARLSQTDQQRGHSKVLE